jgi:mannosylglycerate hydrolase
MDSVVKKTPRPVAVVVQTHWDREWYYPHQTFIARLLSVMTRVVAQLEAGKLTHFLFDGQTAAYEDLLTHGEADLVARVKKLVAEKRIILGPWYIMSDEFLVAGESLIRNLEIGIHDANAAGHCQYVGYLPDTFGHIGQMPQVLKNFAIQHAVMWRGVDSPHAEFNWLSPNGDAVGSVFLTQGYYQHPLNVADWRQALQGYLGLIAPRSIASELLLTQGGDHLQSVDDIQSRIAIFNAEQPEYQLFQSTLAAHAETVMAETANIRATIQGELRNNAQAFVLPDVLSTRRYLKRLNQAAEDRLLYQIEPLLAMLNIDSHPTRYLENTWRSVIQQQAHDSICGCSVDEVHREMLGRYEQITQRLEALQALASDAAGLITTRLHDADARVFADDTAITLFNPTLSSFAGKHIVDIFIRGDEHHALEITACDGTKVACELLACRESAIFRSPQDDFPDRIAGHEYELMIDCANCEIAGMGALALNIAPASSVPVEGDDVEHHTIANEYLRVTLTEAGEINVINLQTGETTNGFFSILTELDAGDSYNYSPPPKQHQVRQSRFAFSYSRVSTMQSELRLVMTMIVPQSLSADRKERHSASVTNSAELTLRLVAGSPMLSVTLNWTNNACDQRTRLLIPVDGDINHTFSDVAFDWVKRPMKLAVYPLSLSRQEMPPVVNPTYSAIQAGKLMFVHRAMQEYEMIASDNARYLGVTLIRSVGWMSRRDLLTRGVGAGPDMATPDAQCLGEEKFEFQIGFAATDAMAALETLQHASRFRKPPVLLRGHSDKWRAEILLDNVHLQLSSLRRIKSEMVDEIEMRLWNPHNTPQKFSLNSTAWRRVMANGETCDAPANIAAAHEIVTLRRATNAAL